MATKSTQQTMLNATIEPKKLTTALEKAAPLVDECKIHLNNDGIAIRAVDPANVGMVDLELEKEVFQKYSANGDIVGVNLERMLDVVGAMDKNDPMRIEIDKQTRNMTVSSNGLEFNVSLIDPNSIRQEPDLPDLDLPAEVIAEGRILDRGVTAADMVSDHISLGVNEETRVFSIEAEGDTDDVNFDVKEDRLVDLTAGPAYSLYSLEYLKDINKAIPKDVEVRMELGEEFPVKMHFSEVFEVEDKEAACNVTYMLAPRVQAD